MAAPRIRMPATGLMLDRIAQPRDVTLSATERRRRERRLWRSAFLLSLAVHLLVFLFWRSTPVFLSPFAAAGPRAGDDQAAFGSLQAVNLGGAAATPVVPPEIPVPTPEDVEPVEFEEDIELEPVEFDVGRLEVDLGSLIGDAPGDLGPGIETGTGRGDGGTAAEGLFRLVPPTPRGMIIPPSNQSLRGRQVEVWVFVDASGRVVPDSTRLRPPTPDRDFNRRLVREAAEWLFQPARQGGRPVASWFPYTISM